MDLLLRHIKTAIIKYTTGNQVVKLCCFCVKLSVMKYVALCYLWILPERNKHSDHRSISP
jgi:hypothetical protein